MTTTTQTDRMPCQPWCQKHVSDKHGVSCNRTRHYGDDVDGIVDLNRTQWAGKEPLPAVITVQQRAGDELTPAEAVELGRILIELGEAAAAGS